MPGSRAGEVMQDKNINRYASYINMDQADFDKLRLAFKKDDVDEMRNILNRSLREPSIEKLMYIYDGIIKEMTKKVIIQNTSMIPKGERKMIKSASLKPYLPQIKPDNKKATSKIIRQKQSSGTSYNRYSPVRYKKMQVTFFKNHDNLSNKQLHVKYNQVFPSRSYSSIVSKKYRLRKKVKK